MPEQFAKTQTRRPLRIKYVGVKAPPEHIGPPPQVATLVTQADKDYVAVRRSTQPLQGKMEQQVEWIHTAGGQYGACLAHAPNIPDTVLGLTRSACKDLLATSGSLASHVATPPWLLDGGWDQLYPHDEGIAFAQIRDGDFAGTAGFAAGPNKKVRERAVALSLLLAACVQSPQDGAHTIRLNTLVAERYPTILPVIHEARRCLAEKTQPALRLQVGGPGVRQESPSDR